jgi:hypothetical protein
MQNHVVVSLGCHVVFETVILSRSMFYKLCFRCPFPFYSQQERQSPYLLSCYAFFLISLADSLLSSINLCSNNLLNSPLLLNRLRRLSANIRVILHHTLQLVSSLLEQQLNIFTLQRIRGLEYA